MNMKKLVILTAITFFSFKNYSQNNQGVAYYVESLNMDSPIEMAKEEIDKEENEMIRAQKKGIIQFLKSYEKTETEMIFNKNRSIYQEREKEITEELNNTDNIFASMKPESDRVYKDFEQNKMTTRKDMGTLFLIKDTLEQMEWKVSGKSKKINGYNCMQATSKKNGNLNIEAWFTPEVPISKGPKNFHGLPGLIVELKISPIKDSLEMDENKSSSAKAKMMMNHMQSNLTVKLEKVEFREVKKNEIKEPKSGKVVNGEKEFNKIMAERIKELENKKMISVETR